MLVTTENNAKTTVLTAPDNRIVVVDMLRGFALLGILVAHMTMWFDGGGLPAAVYQKAFTDVPLWRQILNGIAQFISGVLVQGKFFAFFSFLFGLSFALQLFSFERRGGNFMGRYAWRLVILGIIGLLHSLHWRGDILSIYAPLGFLLFFFRKLSDKALFIIALVLIINIPARVQDVYKNHVSPQSKTQQEQQSKRTEKANEQYYQTMMHGTYWENVKANLRALEEKKDFQVDSGRIYITFGFFLLGLYCGRKKVFEQFPENKPVFKKVLKYTGFTALGLLAVGVVLGLIFSNQPEPPKWVMFVFMTVYDSFNALLTVFYIAGVTLLFARPKWQSRLLRLVPVGKMALTSYVSQTLFGLLIFYGYCGFGLIGLDPWICLLLVFPVFFLQMQFSKWWLTRFQYGPLEWLWRSGTYLRWQPMRQTKTAA